MTSTLSLISTTLTQVFTSAAIIQDNSTYSNAGSGEEFFVYKINNAGSNNPYLATLDFTGDFTGSVEVYAGTEFLRCLFSINNADGAVIEDTYKYNIDYSYYNNEYNAYYPSEPTVSESLDLARVSVDADTTMQLQIDVVAGADVYVLVFADTATYNFKSNITNTTVPNQYTPPPETPNFGSKIDGVGDFVYNFKIPSEILSNIGPANIAVSGSTNKVMKVVITYGNYIKTTNYLYDPVTVEDIDTVRGELEAALSQLGVQVYPISSSSLLDINIDPNSDAQLSIVIETPIPGSIFNAVFSPSPITSAPLQANDSDAGRARGDEPGSNVRRRLRALGYI